MIPRQVAADTAIIDAEIAVLDEQGRSRFGLIQPRIHQTNANEVAHLSRKTPVKMFAFDLLYWNGYDLRNTPLLDRKRALAEIVTPERAHTGFRALHGKGPRDARSGSTDGARGRHREGSDQQVRAEAQPELVEAEGHGPAGVRDLRLHAWRALDLQFACARRLRRGELKFAGCVGTGFNDQTLAQIWKKLKPLETTKNPFGKSIDVLREVTWVEPKLLCDVKFTEWTQDGRLRAPVFIRLRDDKNAEEVVRESAPDEPRFAKDKKEVSLTIDGKVLKFTNLGKVWFPKDGFTKRDVLNYYDAVADLMVPHLRDIRCH